MSKITEVRSGGKTLEAIKISDNLCSVATTLNQLEQYGLMRPTTNAFAKAKDLKGDDLFLHAHQLREIVQRRFDASRNQRAKDYNVYLDQIVNGSRLGGVPPITLFCSDKCEYEENKLILPYRSVLVNIDGETQTEARFILRGQCPESGDWSLAAQIYHGISEQHASQILHDFNRYAHPIKETVVAALNSEGHITKLIEEIMKEKEFHFYEVGRHTPKPNVRKGELCSYRALISAVVGAVSGLKGLQYMAREIGLINNGGGSQLMVEAARPFLTHALDLIRKDSVIGLTPPQVFGIYGAICHDFGHFVNAEQWHAGTAAYTHFRSEERGKIGALKKQQAVIDILGFGGRK